MDDEITGMFQVGKVLEGLDEEARARVLRWAADKFDIDLGQPVEAEEEAAESTDGTMFMGVDPEKVAAAEAAPEAEHAVAPKLQVQPASTLEEPNAPPEKDPDKPSFLDTSFRMYSGKKDLKKAKDEN